MRFLEKKNIREPIRIIHANRYNHITHTATHRATTQKIKNSEFDKKKKFITLMHVRLA